MNRPRSQRLWPLAVPLLCLASMLAIVPAICAQLVRTPTPASTIPHTYFGMHIHGMVTPRPGNTRPAGWPTVPFGSWRLLAAYVDWPQLEPARGQWNFAALDRYLQLAEQHHVEVLLPLVLSPAWASSRPNEKSSYSPGNAAPPANLDDWQTYVRTVATRYKGRISDYEIWNEPSVRTFFSGTPDEMVALTREASRILKEVDPRNVVVSPSAAEGGTSWLDQFLAAGGGKYVDVIGYHFYVRHDPEAMVPVIEQVRRIMEKHGVGNLPLWNTETGWRIANHRSEVKPYESGSPVLADDEASAYVARAYVVAWASGISRFYWYAWDNGVMGLTEADGATVKPPAKAYGEIENWLVGARMKLCDRYSGLWNCRLERDGGYTGNIIWMSGTSKPFELLPAWNMSQERDLEGRTRNIAGAKTVQIGPEPILIENRAP
ncbi:MAG: hypothetical protein DMG88_17355 [Acidobacteria bacterium]|nr:MAG: hypothetical protein DMG88_17355 [Acidobacteriota bacterium]